GVPMPMGVPPIGVPPALPSPGPAAIPAPAPAPGASPGPVPGPVGSSPATGPMATALRKPAPRGDASQPRQAGAGSGRIAAARPIGRIPGRAVQIQPLEPGAVRMLELQAQLLERLVPRLDLDNVPLERLGDEALWQKAESAIVDLV